ncbi:MAG TPA: DUF4374 domain-containing protein [Chitinophagales bacterium]|nr:DUF4374 domain-containing protein [Chitinophagales bacterium]
MSRLNKLSMAAFAVCILLLAGCKKDTGNNPDSPTGYLVGYRTAGTPTADYFVNTSSLDSGVISATGNGVELQGWNYYGKSGNTFFAIDYTNNICKGFEVQNGVLTEKGQFVFERMDCMTEIDENTMLAIGAPWGGGSYDCKIQLVNSSDISIQQSAATPIYVSFDTAGTQLNAWPTHAYIENGKLFIAFYTLVGSTWDTPNTDTAYVSVYSYPGLQYQRTFKDTRTGPIGYYGGSPAMITDEAGNHYSFSTSSKAAGFTQTTKPSGILKVNRGEEQFDPSYFFDIEALGYRILTGTYAGNGKVVARVVSTTVDNTAPAWAAFSVTAPVCNIAVLDLNSKSFNIVSNVPLHGGQYQTPFLLQSGKVYTSVNDGTEAYVYIVDPSAGTAVKGARIEGSELQSFFKY